MTIAREKSFEALNKQNLQVEVVFPWLTPSDRVFKGSPLLYIIAIETSSVEASFL